MRRPDRVRIAPVLHRFRPLVKRVGVDLLDLGGRDPFGAGFGGYSRDRGLIYIIDAESLRLLFEVDLTLPGLFELVRGVSEIRHDLSHFPGDLRQPSRAQEDQRDDPNEYKLGSAYRFENEQEQFDYLENLSRWGRLTYVDKSFSLLCHAPYQGRPRESIKKLDGAALL